MKNKILFAPEAQDALFRGADLLYEAVSTTLGVRGRNVIISRGDNKGNRFGIDSVHDGVTVARAIDIMDEYENTGAQVLKEAAQKTVDEVGDGTTVTIVLAHAILTECRKVVAAGVNPMALRKDLEEGIKRLVTTLEDFTQPITTQEDAIRIATISSEEVPIGRLVGEVLHKIGKDGVVTIEESHGVETYVEYQKGMQLDKGYIHPLFITSPQDLTATLEHPYFLITDKDITTLTELGDLLQTINSRNANLVIIAPSIGGEALPLLIQNKMSGKLNVLCVQAPSFGQNQKNVLQDLAILTGGTYITGDAGHAFKDVVMSDLGTAEYITATKTETIIAGGKGDKKLLTSHIQGIKKALSQEEQEFDRIKLQERYAKLTNGVAVIYVGGSTEIEMRERKERVDDAVHATKAALEKGIVPGGEIIYLQLRDILSDSLADQILYKALERPFIKLVENAGFNAGQLLERIKYLQITPQEGFGIDVTDGKTKNFYEVGIIDPSLVAERALLNAASVAISLITCGAVIVPEYIKE